MAFKLVYDVFEAKENYGKIFDDVIKGVIAEIINTDTNEKMFVINNKILEVLIGNMEISNICYYDENTKKYIYQNRVITQFYGQGTSEDEAIEDMIDEALKFLEEYEANIDRFYPVFTGFQQLILGLLLMHDIDRQKVKEILKIYS